MQLYRNTIGRYLSMTAAVFAGLVVSAQAQAAGPSVNLFPTAVLSEIKETTNTVTSMEKGLVPIVEKMTNQKELYDSTSCEGDQSGSSGCAEILQNISQTYVEMLDKMAEALPELKRSVRNSELMLQKRIATELGRKKTANDLQSDLLQGDFTPVKRQSPARSKRSMSAILQRNFKRIEGAGRSNRTMMSTASDMYLDMRDTSIWIDRLDAQITRQKALTQLNISMGQLPEGMDETISEVVTMVMGEDAGFESDVLNEDPVIESVETDDEFTM